jgi:hypothetical protein
LGDICADGKIILKLILYIYIYIFVCEDVNWIQLTITALPSAEVNILVQKPPVSFVFKQKLKAVDT